MEGQNIAIESRFFGEGRYERLPGLAAELAHLNVKVIVTSDTLAIQAAKHATQTIPIVMVAAIDPVTTGFVASLAQRGGNITALSCMLPELVGKQLEILKEAPTASLRRGGPPFRSSQRPPSSATPCVGLRERRRSMLPRFVGVVPIPQTWFSLSTITPSR